MGAQQIIYTSCRRGIDGTSDGLQVFSYSEGLKEQANDLGPRFSKMFVYPDPKEVGSPAFGYRLIDGNRCLWSYNTKLPYDYKGPQGRGGNVLRQSLIASADGLAIHPIELLGSSHLKSRMGPEAASAEKPSYLPEVELVPGGAVTPSGVAAWLESEGNLDRLADFVCIAIKAKAEGAMTLVVAPPEETAQWVGALSYALPRRLAREISFLLACDQPGFAGGDVTGTTERDLAAVPAYATTNCRVFNPKARGAAGAMAEAAPGYLSFLALTFRTAATFGSSPDRLLSFADFTGDHTDIGFSLEELENAYTLWSLLTGGALANLSSLTAALAFSENHADVSVNAELCARLLDSLDELADQGPTSLVAALGYLLRNMPLIGAGDAARVNSVVASTTSRLLSDQTVTPSDFYSKFSELTSSCSAAGIDMAATLQSEGYANALFAPGEISDPAKLPEFCRAVAGNGARHGAAPEDLGPSGAIGSLVSKALLCAYSLDELQGHTAAIAFARPFATSFTRFKAAATLSVESYRAFRGATAPGIIILWNEICSLLPVHERESIPSIVDWLCAEGEYARAVDAFTRSATEMETSADVAALFKRCCECRMFQDGTSLRSCYPGIARAYIDELSRRADDGARRALTSFLDMINAALQNQTSTRNLFADIVAPLAAALVRPINVTAPERTILNKLDACEAAFGAPVIDSRGVLALALDRLMHPPKNLAQLINFISHHKDRLDLGVLSADERMAYIGQLVNPLVHLAERYEDYARVLSSFAIPEPELIELMDRCVKIATRQLKSRRDGIERLAVLFVYAAAHSGTGIRERIAARASKLSGEQLTELEQVCRRLPESSRARREIAEMLNRARTGGGLLSALGSFMRRRPK